MALTASLSLSAAALQVTQLCLHSHVEVLSGLIARSAAAGCSLSGKPRDSGAASAVARSSSPASASSGTICAPPRTTNTYTISGVLAPARTPCKRRRRRRPRGSGGGGDGDYDDGSGGDDGWNGGFGGGDDDDEDDYDEDDEPQPQEIPIPMLHWRSLWNAVCIVSLVQTANWLLTFVHGERGPACALEPLSSTLAACTYSAYLRSRPAALPALRYVRRGARVPRLA